jgi:large subunit ribosomal protein L13
MKTNFLSKEQALKERKWLVVDAQDQTLGRLASKVATLLRGKHKPFFTPHVDCGDFVVILNADKVKVTGNKLTQKKYYRHSGYIGGIKETGLDEMIAKSPERVIELAVKRMLPKGSLGRSMGNKLKVYSGTEHPHSAQQPEAVAV